MQEFSGSEPPNSGQRSASRQGGVDSITHPTFGLRKGSQSKAGLTFWSKPNSCKRFKQEEGKSSSKMRSSSCRILSPEMDFNWSDASPNKSSVRALNLEIKSLFKPSPPGASGWDRR